MPWRPKPGTFDPSSAGTTFVGDDMYPELKPCSIEHDRDYHYRTKSRRKADMAFLACMLAVAEKESDLARRQNLYAAAEQRYWIVSGRAGWFAWNRPRWLRLEWWKEIL